MAYSGRAVPRAIMDFQPEIEKLKYLSELEK
jgi:hypothetical protein